MYFGCPQFYRLGRGSLATFLYPPTVERMLDCCVAIFVDTKMTAQSPRDFLLLIKPKWDVEGDLPVNLF